MVEQTRSAHQREQQKAVQTRWADQEEEEEEEEGGEEQARWAHQEEEEEEEEAHQTWGKTEPLDIDCHRVL